MIKHISMFRLSQSTDEPEQTEKLLFVKTQLEALPKEIDFIKESFVGTALFDVPSVSPPLLSFCDLVQILTFDTAEAAAAYPPQPAHLSLSKICSPLLSEIASIDFEI